jgi:hypothetical protein
MVLIGCASTPKGEPTKFEGRWVADTIEDGTTSSAGVYLIGLWFNKDQVGMKIGYDFKDESIRVINLSDGSPTSGFGSFYKFSYTDTQISIFVNKKGSPQIFEYTFDAGRLITTHTNWGRIVWVKASE